MAVQAVNNETGVIQPARGDFREGDRRRAACCSPIARRAPASWRCRTPIFSSSPPTSSAGRRGSARCWCSDLGDAGGDRRSGAGLSARDTEIVPLHHGLRRRRRGRSWMACAKQSGFARSWMAGSWRRAERSLPPKHHASPTIACYRMPGVPAAAQMMQLDLAGIAVSAGSACSSGSLKTSHVLAAMGWREEEAREVIRVSFGPHHERQRHRRLARRMAGPVRGSAGRRERARSISTIRRPRRSPPKRAPRCGRGWKIASPTRTPPSAGPRGGGGCGSSADRVLNALQHRSSRAKPRAAGTEFEDAPLDDARDERRGAALLHLRRHRGRELGAEGRGGAASGEQKADRHARDRTCLRARHSGMAWAAGLRGGSAAGPAGRARRSRPARSARWTSAPVWSRQCWSTTRSA